MSNPNSTRNLDLLVVFDSDIVNSASQIGMQMLESDH